MASPPASVGKSNARVIARGRATGAFELAGRSLAEVPEHVYNHQLELPEGTINNNNNWWERVDPVKLNISRNSLTTMPDMLYTMMHTLVSLDISHNPLECGLSPGITALKGLRVLVASHCQLMCLPDEVATLPLNKLDVSHNRLTTLPERLCADVAALGELDVSNNQLRELPSSLVGMTSLSTLDVSNNQLTMLHDGLFESTNLRMLDASHNALATLPPAIGALHKLAVLNLRANQLSTLPATLAEATSLVELHAGLNALRTLPEDLSSLQRLRVLDLGRNYLTAWPKGLCGLKLSLLDLNSNELRDLPAELGLMTSLRALRLEGNPIRSIRQNYLLGPVSGLLDALRSRLPNPEEHEADLVVASFSRIAAAKRAQEAAEGEGKEGSKGDRPMEVVVKSGGLTKVPEDVAFLASCLVKLDLSSNKLQALGDDMLLRAAALKVLMLPDNQLQQWPLPKAAACLEGLWHCNLARNPMASIPADAFAACPNLKVLDLSGVEAVARDGLPGVRQLQHLSEVILMRCGLETFPDALLQLPALRVCNLSGNRMVELPAGLGRMKTLTVLDVSNNELSRLPAELGKLQDTLRTLLVEGNPLRSIRRNVLTAGTAGLLEYLLARLPVDDA